MHDSVPLLALTALATLPPQPSRIAWKALQSEPPTLACARRARGAMIVQPYYDRATRQHWRSLGQPEGMATLCPARRDRHGFGPGLMRVDAVRPHGYEPLDAFPYLGPGTEVEAQVLAICTTPDRLQAEILLDIRGQRLTVFDAAFDQARAVYRPQQHYRFALAALAVELGATQPDDTTRRLHPAQRATSQVCGELRQVRADAAAIHGRALWRMTLHSAVGGQALRLPVLAQAGSFAPGWQPTNGALAHGRVWLQAELVGTA